MLVWPWIKSPSMPHEPISCGGGGGGRLGQGGGGVDDVNTILNLSPGPSHLNSAFPVNYIPPTTTLPPQNLNILLPWWQKSKPPPPRECGSHIWVIFIKHSLTLIRIKNHNFTAPPPLYFSRKFSTKKKVCTGINKATGNADAYLWQTASKLRLLTDFPSLSSL